MQLIHRETRAKNQLYSNQKIAKLVVFHCMMVTLHILQSWQQDGSAVTGNKYGNSHMLEVLLGDAEPGGLVVPPLVVVVHRGQA